MSRFFSGWKETHKLCYWQSIQSTPSCWNGLFLDLHKWYVLFSLLPDFGFSFLDERVYIFMNAFCIYKLLVSAPRSFGFRIAVYSYHFKTVYLPSFPLFPLISGALSSTLHLSPRGPTGGATGWTDHTDLYCGGSSCAYSGVVWAWDPALSQHARSTTTRHGTAVAEKSQGVAQCLLCGDIGHGPGESSCHYRSERLVRIRISWCYGKKSF